MPQASLRPIVCAMASLVIVAPLSLVVWGTHKMFPSGVPSPVECVICFIVTAPMLIAVPHRPSRCSPGSPTLGGKFTAE